MNHLCNQFTNIWANLLKWVCCDDKRVKCRYQYILYEPGLRQGGFAGGLELDCRAATHGRVSSAAECWPGQGLTAVINTSHNILHVSHTAVRQRSSMWCGVAAAGWLGGRGGWNATDGFVLCSQIRKIERIAVLYPVRSGQRTTWSNTTQSSPPLAPPPVRFKHQPVSWINFILK